MSSSVTSPAPRRSSEALLSWIGSLFTFDRKQFHPAEGPISATYLFLPLLVLKWLGHEELWLSFAFGAIYTRATYIAVDDGAASSRRWSIGFVLVGTVLTALAYLLGGANWIVVVLAVFVNTFLSYLPSAYSPHGATGGVLLNFWFLIALSTTSALGKPPSETWPLAGPQALAWLTGGAFWMVFALVWRALFDWRPESYHPAPDQNLSAGRISRPLVSFAGYAALAVASATAVAWGFHVPDADWMPLGALVAMKPKFDASVYIAGQRVAGALIGAILAALLLTLVSDRTILLVLIVVFVGIGNAVHDANYALFYACISTEVLISLGLPHPGDLAENWARVAWTLVGVGIAISVTFVADPTRHKGRTKVLET
jgi:Fusaric acid resistance protein-like